MPPRDDEITKLGFTEIDQNYVDRSTDDQDMASQNFREEIIA